MKREPPHFSHVMIHWHYKKTLFIEESLMHHEASVMHPIFQIIFFHISYSSKHKKNLVFGFFLFASRAILGSWCEGLISSLEVRDCMVFVSWLEETFLDFFKFFPNWLKDGTTPYFHPHRDTPMSPVLKKYFLRVQQLISPRLHIFSNVL